MAQAPSSRAMSTTRIGTAIGSQPGAGYVPQSRTAPLSAAAWRSPPGHTDSCDTSPPAVRNKALEPLSSGVHYVKRVSPKALRRRALRREAVKRLGGRCVLCGSTENLELDHRDPFTRTKRGKEMLRSRRRMEAELPLLQLLCNPCHIEKSRIDRALKQGSNAHWQHGTITGYFAHRCKCAECMEAMRAYHRQRKAS